MIYVKFKDNPEPCICYKVNGGPEYQFCDKSESWALHYDIDVLGWVPVDILENTNNPLNSDAMDVAIYLRCNEKM